MSTSSTVTPPNNKLLSAIGNLKKMIPENYLKDTSVDANLLPMTSNSKKNAKKKKPGKHIIQLSSVSHADVKLLLNNYCSTLSTSEQQRLLLYMRLIKRDQPTFFVKFQKWFPVNVKTFFSDLTSSASDVKSTDPSVKSIDPNVKSVAPNVKSTAPVITVTNKLTNWDKKTIPYLHDTVLKATAMRFSTLNSDHRNLLIEYLNQFAKQRPLDIVPLRKYIEKLDPKNPVLTMTSLCNLEPVPTKKVVFPKNNTKKDNTLIAPGNKLSGWDGLTVPYLTLASLKNNANSYTNWQHEKKLCFLKYLCLLHKTYPQQTLMLTVFLRKNNPNNPLLQLSPLSGIKHSLFEFTTTEIEADDVTENGNEITGKQLKDAKSELMDIGDTSLEHAGVKNNSLNLNATMPHNKIIMKLNFKNTKFNTVPQPDAVKDETELFLDKSNDSNSLVCILSDNEDSTSAQSNLDKYSTGKELHTVEDVLSNNEDSTSRDDLNIRSNNQICETSPMKIDNYLYNQSNLTLMDFL